MGLTRTIGRFQIIDAKTCIAISIYPPWATYLPISSIIFIDNHKGAIYAHEDDNDFRRMTFLPSLGVTAAHPPHRPFVAK